MSTNYYIQRKTLPQRWGTSLRYVEFYSDKGKEDEGEYAIHLCHTTVGWYTLFQSTPLYRSYAELIAECEKSIAEGAVIKDEYDNEYTLEEFKTLALSYETAEKKETEQQGIVFMTPISHIDYASKLQSRYIGEYYKDEDGREFSTSEFC